MGREKENFRDELEQLIKFFGDERGENVKRVLSASDVARYTGRDRRWCQRTYSIDPQRGITIVGLARQLS